MEIFAIIGAFAKANPIATIVIGIMICVLVSVIKHKNTKPYFCTDCGRVVDVQFRLDGHYYQQIRPCIRCGNNVASSINTGQGVTYRQGGRNIR